MVEKHLPLRATGLARALGVLVLLAGIVAMHAAVFAVHGEAAAADHHAMAAVDITPDPMSVEHGSAGKDDRSLPAMSMAVTGPAVLSDANHVVPKPNCAGDGCGGTHGGMHGCVFILAAAALLLALVLLYRLGVARPGNAVARLRHRRPRRERSPPWTVLSLAELSILRI
ncbi:DUF6153 family protein [Nocardia colli]|uniref:DUF6153 family protein n=1 Tax=Nocardia colli TaxID=2545717 RepID=UPI0035DEA46D